MRFSSLKDYYGNPLERLTVTGDGNATVHLYYDRDVVTLRFNYPEDVSQATTVEHPDYYPDLPASGTVTQTAVTAISSVNYPEDVTLYGLYGGQITDGKAEDGGSAQWPVAYEASGLVYTLTTRTMQFSGGKWNQKSASSKTVTETSRSFPTYWKDADGVPVDNLGVFGHGSALTPTHTLNNLRQWSANSTVSYFRENEQAAYPASAVYPAAAAYSFTVVNGETLVVENPFTGFELDYFTYTDSRGTPIRREGGATLEQRTLTGGSFSSLKVYCKRSIHHVIFHNDESIIASLGVKYDMSLATDYIRQYTAAPELPAGKDADQWEFAGWYVDPGCSIYLDFAGLKAADRSKLMQQYDNIHEFASVYDYRVPGGQVLPAMLMTNGDLHLFAGWVKRRVPVELEPEGGELPESLPTFFWTQLGTTLNLPPISRDYVPGEQGTGNYLYHIHTYEQSQKDNDITDRIACYVPRSEEDSGDRYSYLPNSYRFLGWFQVEQRANGSEELVPFDPDTPLTGSVRLRAQWSRQGVYQLVYDKGAHGELSNNTVSSTFYRDHATIALNGDVTPEPGYVFTGWKILRPDGSGELLDQLYSSGDELVINADWAVITQNEYAENRGVITLVAQYEPVKGTSITYYVNGGTYVGPSNVTPEVKQQLLEKLRREYGDTAAHHFIKDETGTIIGYTISGIEQNASLTTEDGTWFQRSGYKLMGWSSTPDGPVELELHAGGFNAASDPEGKGFVLYAVWKAEEQVTYDLQGGYWNSSNGQEYHRLENGNWVCSTGYGETAPIPYAPTREGYAFAGWARSSTAGKGLQTMPRVTGSITLYAIWTQKAVLRFDLGGGSWTSLQKDFVALDRSCYGVLVNPGSSYTLPSHVPVREGDYLFHKWEHGSYQYSAGASLKTTAEQAGQTLTLTTKWSQGIPVEEILVGSDNSITLGQSDSVVGTTEDGSISMSHREISGYQYLYVLYDDVPQTKGDITELYRVITVRRLSDQAYQVTLANGQTKTHYPDSVQKLQAIYIQDRPVDVNLVRMNVFEDGMDEMNLTLTPLKNEPYTQLNVGMVDISKALPKPKEYAKVGSTDYRSYVRVWVEVKDNVPLRIVGRLEHMGRNSTTDVSSTDVYGFLPRDEQGRVVADGTQMLVGEEFTAFKSNIPYAYDPEVTYSSESLGNEVGNAIYAVAYATDADGYRYWTYWKTDSSEPQRLNGETLYATYTANYSPVNVRYVVENNGVYSEVVDMDEDVAPVLVGNTIRADQTEKKVTEALALQLSEIDGYSTLYRTTKTFVLGSADLAKVYYASSTSDVTLQFENYGGSAGIRYQDGTNTAVLTGSEYPDLYVVLKPVATLTLTKLIDDTGGYALWDDRFAITVQLSDSSFDKTYQLDVTSDLTQEHAAPEGQQQVTFVNGTAVITLQHAQSIAIPELPRGVGITVSEEPGSRYRVRYLVRQGELETVGNEFELNRHTSVTVTNISHDLTNTGEEFSDGGAYALLLCGGAAYGLYLLMRRKKA